MAESEGKKEESPQTRNEKKKKLSLKYTLKETAGLEFVFLIILRRGKRDNLVPEKVGSLRKPHVKSDEKEGAPISNIHSELTRKQIKLDLRYTKNMFHPQP